MISDSAFTTVLYIVILALAVLNVAPIKTPKISSNWYYGIVAYTLILTVFFGWQLTQAAV